jgi:hypothetical protein
MNPIEFFKKLRVLVAADVSLGLKISCAIFCSQQSLQDKRSKLLSWAKKKSQSDQAVRSIKLGLFSSYFAAEYIVPA